MNKIKKEGQKGTALLMSVLILNTIIFVSLAVSQIGFSSIKMGRNEIISTKAYFAAEAGAERILWEFRKGSCSIDPQTCNFSDIVENNGYSSSNSSFYRVIAEPSSNVIFVSTGRVGEQYRTIELSLDLGS